MPPLLTVAALLASAALAGLARGFSGFGAALIFVPLAAALTSPAVAAPLLLVIDAVAALGLLRGAWRVADRREVGIMALGALAGVPAGTLLLTSLDAVVVRWLLAVAILGILVLLMSGWRFAGRPRTPLTAGIGALAGFMSGIAQMGGPPVAAYWLGSTATAATARANIILYFAVSTALTALSYGLGGLFTREVLGLAIAVGPVYALALLVGARLFGLASEATFRRTCWGLIATAGIVSLPVLDGVLR